MKEAYEEQRRRKNKGQKTERSDAIIANKKSQDQTKY